MNNLSDRIVIVDDIPHIAIFIEDLLKDAGFKNIVRFNDPVVAVEDINSNPPPALIITDFNMPKLNGLELLKLVETTHGKFNAIIVSAEAKEVMALPHNYHVIDKMYNFNKKFIDCVRNIFKNPIRPTT
jgi:DNA-binding NtrC family response regulator